jgi:hypothetical protein
MRGIKVGMFPLIEQFSVTISTNTFEYPINLKVNNSLSSNQIHTNYIHTPHLYIECLPSSEFVLISTLYPLEYIFFKNLDVINAKFKRHC